MAGRQAYYRPAVVWGAEGGGPAGGGAEVRGTAGRGGAEGCPAYSVGRPATATISIPPRTFWCTSIRTAFGAIA